MFAHDYIAIMKGAHMFLGVMTCNPFSVWVRMKMRAMGRLQNAG